MVSHQQNFRNYIIFSLLTKMVSRTGWNGGPIWPVGRSLETPGLAPQNNAKPKSNCNADIYG